MMKRFLKHSIASLSQWQETLMFFFVELINARCLALLNSNGSYPDIFNSARHLAVINSTKNIKVSCHWHNAMLGRPFNHLISINFPF